MCYISGVEKAGLTASHHTIVYRDINLRRVLDTLHDTRGVTELPCNFAMQEIHGQHGTGISTRFAGYVEYVFT